MPPTSRDLLDPVTGSQKKSWAAFAPGLHVADQTRWAEDKWLEFAPEQIEALRQLIVREGYFQLDPVQWDLPLAAMAQVIEHLVAMGLPAVFAFHYDEFWLIYMRTRQIVAGLLGNDYLMLPDFWAWHVDPARDESGWKPHRDKGRRALREDGSPKSLTIWLPLTDATPLNGCMYMVPADRDVSYNTEDEDNFKFMLNDIRALPAKAGGILAWNAAVLHWGAHAAPRQVPARISLALEFQRRDTPPFRAPLMDPFAFIDLPTRQALIGRQIIQYRHMYPLSPELAECAAWMRGLAPEGALPG